MVLGGMFVKWAYDLHIHTAASPCGDENMTPHNIVNMSLLKGLDLIAITDHQTVANCEAVMKVGKAKGLRVIAGMELECMEEFHMIALFPHIKAARDMEKWLGQFLPPIPNKPSIFGRQSILNEEDECIGEIARLLLVAANVAAEEILKKGRSLGALIYPAHIDRQSYSILSNLGSIPQEYALSYLEVSKAASYTFYEKAYPGYTLIQSSDAHYLQDIAEREAYIEADILKHLVSNLDIS
ncbi:MAG: PHP domain-containing protein [Cellulosilyticum sp.]|nr:PHP domain-containing protein [Cellulosilyticum sp.]